MNRKQLIDETTEYFRSTQWREVVQAVQERDTNHMHVYVDSYLHPYQAFAPLVLGYFEARGWEAYRPYKQMTNKPGHAALYSIDLRDKANFEIYIRLNQGAILAPMPPDLAERNANVRVWTDRYVRRFQDQFSWRHVSAAEEREVIEFFRTGKHWQRTLEYVVDPDVVHVHCNIETSVRPELIRRHAMDDLRARGWKFMHAIHSVFTRKGGLDTGKIIILGLEPERTYDIAWYYNPDIVIQPNTQDAGMVGDAGTGNEYYVVRVSSGERELPKHAFHTLTSEEIAKILKNIGSFDTRSGYSWRMLPT
jgi:hypothetical protein